MHTRNLFFFPILVAATAFASCAPEGTGQSDADANLVSIADSGDPLANAKTFTDTTIPKDAKIITESQLIQKIQTGESKLITSGMGIREKLVRETMIAKGEEVLIQNPTLGATVNRVRAFQDGYFELGSRGNYRVVERDLLGTTERFTTLSRSQILGEIGRAADLYDDRDNQLGIKEELEKIPFFATDPTKIRPIPGGGGPGGGCVKCKAVTGENTAADSALSLDSIRADISTHAARFSDYWQYAREHSDPYAKPAGYPSSCSSEYGSELGNDLSSNVCARSANGLWEQSTFALKWKDTCIKSQGNRGSCTAFAGIAAVEIEANLALDGVWTNLSEQHYYWNELTNGPEDSINEDGFSIVDGLLQAYQSDYLFSLERFWNYNPSSSRYELSGADGNTVWANSCAGYSGEMCTETAHQGQVECASSGGRNAHTVCTYTAPSTGAGYKINGVLSLLNPFIVEESIDLAQTFVMAGRPVIIATEVTAQFRAATQNAGYVTYESGEESQGGHAILLIGYVGNEDLPAGAPQADGGGYFIARNSWGTCGGDGGYWYIPKSFAQEYFYGIFLLKEGIR